MTTRALLPFFFFIANYCVELLAVVIFYLPQYVLHHIEVSFFCPEVLLNHHVAKCCFYLVQLCCDWQVYVNVHLLEFGKQPMPDVTCCLVHRKQAQQTTICWCNISPVWTYVFAIFGPHRDKMLQRSVIDCFHMKPGNTVCMKLAHFQEIYMYYVSVCKGHIKKGST